MKANVFLSVSAMILLIGFTSLNSQPGLTPCHRESNRPAPYTDFPDLTVEQQQDIESLRKQFRDEMKSIRESGEFSREQIRMEYLSRRSELHREIEALLSPEQMETMNQKMINGPFTGNQVRNLRSHERYANGQILQLLIENRVEFENHLTTEEKKIIASMRIKVSDHRELMRNLEPGELTLAERKEIRSKHFGEIQPLREIGQKYRSEISSINRNIGDEIWPACANSESKPCVKRFQNRKTEQQGTFIQGIRFLLLEPMEKSNKLPDSGSKDIRIYPNPATKSFTIEFELEQPGIVEIELLNRNGDVIEILDHTIRSSGINVFNYDGGPVATPGVYFIRVKTSEKTMTRKLIRN
jgi:hypothetical protein